MRFAVEQWAPDYGAATNEAALTPSEAPTDLNVEVRADEWAPRTVPPETSLPAALLFVDGVRRIDARVWIEGGGTVHPGICATYAAGAVRCAWAGGSERSERTGLGTARRAEIVGAEVRRGLFCATGDAADIDTRHGAYTAVTAAGDSNEQLSLTLQERMGDLEVAVARACQVDGEPVIVDGPLRQHRHLPGAVGYVKTQHRAYGPAIVLETCAALVPGQRTPVFVIGAGFTRYSWYVRLPVTNGNTAPAHPLAGVVRCEAAGDLRAADAIALADRVTAALPRFASRPHKDPRAPQNLYPIAGLERALRRRLGDGRLLERALRRAATESGPGR